MLKIRNYKAGMKIKKPCVIRGMPDDVYHSSIGLSNSGLKTLLDCPAKYYFKYLSGDYTPKEKPSFKIGKACHKYILEGRKAFEEQYWYNPYSEYKKDELVAIFKSIFDYDNVVSKLTVRELTELLLDKAEIIPKEIHLNLSELNQVIGMSKMINSDERAKNAFSQKGESELSLFWQDEETGIWLKCRPDFLPYDCKFVPDYKTAVSANPRTFYGDFLKFGYFVQAAMYRQGIKAVTGIDVESFFFIVQEKEEPFISQPFLPSMRLVDWGDKVIRNGIQKYVECQESGLWPGYTDKVVELSIEFAPDEIVGGYDLDNAVAYAPYSIDRILSKYEV